MCCWKNDKNNVCPFEDSGGWAEGGRVERKAGGGGESSLGRQSKDSRAKKKKNGKTRRTEKRKIFFRISSADLILSLPGPAGSLLKVGRDKGKTGS